MKRFVAGIAVGATLAVTLTGTAYAASGGTFVLGRNNAASSQTLLTNSGASPVLALSTRAGQVPLAVSVHAAKATNLNADRVDGVDSTQLQRLVTGSCVNGGSVAAVASDGSVTCTSTVVEEAEQTTTTNGGGDAAIYCPFEGDRASNGGWTLPASKVAVANAQFVFTQETRQGFVVRMLNTDGTPYVGPILLKVRCERAAPGEQATR